jgi:Pregnancy-associated plasma protein-A
MRLHAPLKATVFFISMILLHFNNLNAQDCGSNLDLKKLRQTDPVAYQEHLRLEKIISDYRQRISTNPNARLIDNNGIITVPIVFHVIHRGEGIGFGANISDARLIDQVAVLNECFSQTNNDQSLISSAFKSLASNPNIRFQLACYDPSGASTTGIIRRTAPSVSSIPPSILSYNSDANNAKFTSMGGLDAWATDRYLNIWITPNLIDNDGGNLFGYAQFPDKFVTSPNTDGVVIRYDVVGRNPSNTIGRTEGRTLVHEVGHWLDAIHLFDNGCSNNDGCADTPPQSIRTPEDVVCPLASPYFPLGQPICANTPNGVMYDNFMDGTNENCGRRMFTRDQVIRMRGIFQPGGTRSSFIDNYFKVAKANQTCTEGLFFVKTPFCEVSSNTNWSITGPATIAPAYFSNILRTVYPDPTGNGTAVLSASWNNFVSDIAITVGYGTESSTYTTYDNYSSSSPVLTLRNGGFYSAKTNTYGTLSFTGANGIAKNWRIFSQSGQAYLNGYGNNFSLSVYPNSNVTIRADIPTACGDRMVQYTFYRSGYQYALSPNPASNNITITALNVSADPNAGTTSEMPEYEVQIFTRYNQLMKKTKCPKGSKDITIDVSDLPSNQLYTVQFISSEDVQTKSFFKE